MHKRECDGDNQAFFYYTFIRHKVLNPCDNSSLIRIIIFCQFSPAKKMSDIKLVEQAEDQE
jgi:hypothetical protein